jgi:hypothetical protein
LYGRRRLNPSFLPLGKGGIPLFGKEGLGEIFGRNGLLSNDRPRDNKYWGERFAVVTYPDKETMWKVKENWINGGIKL